MNKRIEIEHVTASYSGKTVLSDISLTVYANDFLGIIGSNGEGKTTLLKVISGLLPPAQGTIRYFRNGKQASSLKIGYLPQINALDRKFPIAVREVIASGLASEKPVLRSFSREQNSRIDDVAGLMGVGELLKRPIGELSGGQLQRVLLSRAFVSRPEVLVLDEPNSYIDKHFEPQFHELLKQANQDSAIILVSHDVETVRHLAGRIILVENNQLTEDERANT